MRARQQVRCCRGCCQISKSRAAKFALLASPSNQADCAGQIYTQTLRVYMARGRPAAAWRARRGRRAIVVAGRARGRKEGCSAPSAAARSAQFAAPARAAVDCEPAHSERGFPLNLGRATTSPARAANLRKPAQRAADRPSEAPKIGRSIETLARSKSQH